MSYNTAGRPVFDIATQSISHSRSEAVAVHMLVEIDTEAYDAVRAESLSMLMGPDEVLAMRHDWGCDACVARTLLWRLKKAMFKATGWGPSCRLPWPCRCVVGRLLSRSQCGAGRPRSRGHADITSAGTRAVVHRRHAHQTRLAGPGQPDTDRHAARRPSLREHTKPGTRRSGCCLRFDQQIDHLSRHFTQSLRLVMQPFHHGQPPRENNEGLSRALGGNDQGRAHGIV